MADAGRDKMRKATPAAQTSDSNSQGTVVGIRPRSDCTFSVHCAQLSIKDRPLLRVSVDVIQTVDD